MDKQMLRQQNAALRRDAATRNSLDNLVGESEAMQKLKSTIRIIAGTTSTVIITGESGTGKELVARAIHTCSPRANEPFVSINCGAFPETLLESELFGYVKGAFTGANTNKRGLFEMAHGGTLFLDEISETTLAMQVKLLRVLQERTIRPLGGGAETPIDVRVIAATNKDLYKLVADAQFREDLYYRLSVIPIQVPPLRDRADDIVILANHFLKKFAGQMGKKIQRISNEALQTMKSYDWPGNVRVLENTIERAVAMESTEELHIELPNAGNGRNGGSVAGVAGAPGVVLPQQGIDMEKYLAEVEKSLLQSAMRRCNGVQTKAAELLHLSYRSFRHLMKKYDL
jgi:two-component system response regulator PilR (NtrC family)